MGTVSQHSSVQNKALGHTASKKSTKTPSHPLKNGISLSSEPDSQQRLRRSRADVMLIMTNPMDRQHDTKVSSHRTGPKQRRQRQHSRGQGSARESSDQSRTPQGEAGDDSGSDLSDSERFSVLPARIAPPELSLRAEVVDPSDLHPSRRASRGREQLTFSYPDFLPPPFNSWSLKQLAVYLNTDGRGVARPRPVGQLERYLDRLLQMEWHQIQTVQEDSGRSTPKCRHPPPQLRLSSPKCILQCQRGFPLTLLSSLASAPSLWSCSCPLCQSHYPLPNGWGRSRACHQPTRLGPLLEHSGAASAVPRRSSSESRSERPQRPREHRLSDPLSDSSHWRRMQAVGNIRHPPGSTLSARGSETPADVRRRRSGQRSRSCASVREERGQRNKSQPSADGSDGLCASKDSSRLIRKQKRVGFVTQ